MSYIEPITEEELRGFQKRLRPDDSISIPPYEGMSPQEAAKIGEMYDKKIENRARLDKNERDQYEAAQQIADKGGVLPSDLKPYDGPFLNDMDMMKKEGV